MLLLLLLLLFVSLLLDRCCSSDFPKLRFDDAKPFSSIGLDYLGPLSVLPAFPPYDKMHKIHVVLYTCAATRGVVLDIVGNLSSASFVNSLRRFIAERGVPRLIVSDHGSAFTAAETQSFVSDRVIRWQFNLEAAPWWGGIFESLVKSVKNCLKKIVGLRRIDYVEHLIVFYLVDVCSNLTIELLLMIFRKKLRYRLVSAINI